MPAASRVQHQGVVTGGFHGLRQAREHPPIVVVDPGGFAMHDGLGVDHVATEGLADGLMAQADPQQRNPSGKALHHRQGNARFIGGAGPGGEHDALRAMRSISSRPMASLR